MKHRNAATLAEVLIAIFCMGIGMISIFALFPLGFQNMAASVRNNRLAQAAANAEAMAVLLNVRGDPTVATESNYDKTQPTNPNSAKYDPSQPQPIYDPSFPGPPVLVDPLGLDSYGHPNPDPDPATYQANKDEKRVGRKPVGGAQTQVLGPATVYNPRGIARTGCSAIPQGQAYKFMASADDLTFDPAVPGQAKISPVERERKYTWAYVWRQPRHTNRQVVELSIVLYAGRKLEFNYNPAAADTRPAGEDAYASTTATGVFAKGSTTAYIPWNPSLEPQPALKKGVWIFDSTEGNGYFYRVVSVSDPEVRTSGEGLQIPVELHQPARDNGGVAVLMANVVEVIEKGTGKTP